MVTVTSVNNGDKLLVSLDKQALKLLPEVANHPALSNEANWGKVSVILKDTSSIKRLVAAFTGDFTQPDYVTPKMTKKDQFFQLHKIVISSPTRSTILAIKKDQVPNSSQQTAILFSGNAISQNTLNLDENVTINKLFIKPKRASWSIFTNNLGPNTVITYDDANKRVLVTAN